MISFFKDNAVALQTFGGVLQAVFALVLAFVGVMQLLVYYRMRSVMVRQAAISRHQVRIAREQADLTEKQFLLTGRQTDLTERQHGLTRLHYITDKRPRLTIRHVIIDNPTPNMGYQSWLFQPEHPVRGSLVVVNNGGTVAKITDSRYRIYYSNVGLPINPPLDEASVKSLHAPAAVAIEGGKSCTFQISTEEPLGHVGGEITHGRNNWRLYVMGYIRYADLTDKERFMWFCREYHRPDVVGGEGRFVAVDNPDYEAQD